jgi:hypothetical protein
MDSRGSKLITLDDGSNIHPPPFYRRHSIHPDRRTALVGQYLSWSKVLLRSTGILFLILAQDLIVCKAEPNNCFAAIWGNGKGNVLHESGVSAPTGFFHTSTRISSSLGSATPTSEE